MSINCQIKAINDKLVATLEGLCCLEEGETPPWTEVDPNAPIACQLEALLAMQCLAAEKVVCEGGECEACFIVKGFDYERGVEGFYNSGNFGATVNGVATSTPWNFISDQGKAAAYQSMIDQVNATAGWSVSVTSDPSMNTNDLVEFKFEYSGDCGEAAILSMQRTTGTKDLLTLDANNGSGSFVDDAGDEISSGRQPTTC